MTWIWEMSNISNWRTINQRRGWRLLFLFKSYCSVSDNLISRWRSISQMWAVSHFWSYSGQHDLKPGYISCHHMAFNWLKLAELGKLLSKCNILLITTYFHFKVIYYVTILLPVYSNIWLITLLFSYSQQNARIAYIGQWSRCV